MNDKLIIDDAVKKNLESGYYFDFLAKVKLKNGTWIYNVRIINKKIYLKGFTKYLEKLSKKEKILFTENEFDDPFEKQDIFIGNELDKFISYDNIISEYSICEINKYENFIGKDFLERLGNSNEYTEEYFPEFFWIFTLEFKNGKMLSSYLKDHEKTDGNESGSSFERHIYLPENLNIEDITKIHRNKIILNGELIDYNDYIKENNLFDFVINLDFGFICPINHYNTNNITREDFNIHNKIEYFDFNEDEEDLPF